VTDDSPIVYIVDDERAVRESLELLLDVRGFKTRSFQDGASFLAAYRTGSPGCALIDLRMPGMSGAELQVEMVTRGIALPVVVVTAHGDVAATRKAFKAGAVDFIEKPVEAEALIAAVEAALATDATQRERADRTSSAFAQLEQLTARERQVVDLAVEGRHNREIAIELGISPRTVEVYKARAMEKLGIKRLPDLVRIVLNAQRGLE
jgi:two-component system response regulator FixJ